MWHGDIQVERTYQMLQSNFDFLPMAAAITVVLAMITTIITLYIISCPKSSSQLSRSGIHAAFSGGMEEKWKSFSYPEFREFLTNFLLHDEILVFDSLVSFLVKDGVLSPDVCIPGSDIDAGWRNKHRIAESAGVSHRKVYSKNSIVDRMLELGIVESRKADSKWGRQKLVYRLDLESGFVKSYLRTILQKQIEEERES